MSAHPVEILGEFALGALAPAEALPVAAHVAGCPACAAEVAAFAALADALPSSLEPAAPPASARARLLAAVAGPERFGPFSGRFARLFDLPRGAALRLLAEAARGEGYEAADALGPGVRLKHFAAGPAAQAHDAGFVHVPAGAPFPHHRHDGAEATFVLQGACVEHSTGRTLRPGELLHLPAGSEHTFAAGPGEDLVFAVLLLGPVVFQT